MAAMSNTFDGRNVVVTGGAGAVGGAVVSDLLAQGARVHLPVRDADERASLPRDVAERLADASEVDLGDEAATRAFYDAVPDLWASVNCAGGFAMAPIEETAWADVESMLRTNLRTCFVTCREALRRMRAGGEGGRIVNVAARPAAQPAGGMTAYAVSKAAVASLTQCLAEEVRSERILVNAVLPSIMDTRANRAAMPDASHEDWPKVEEVSAAIRFLASPENTLTTGALVPVYGRA